MLSTYPVLKAAYLSTSDFSFEAEGSASAYAWTTWYSIYINAISLN